ncbi:MAG: o-succinylbenzoate synthase [Azonexus sp.]|nr:o-succinylbenzoate synthase [Azonexus sp.]
MKVVSADWLPYCLPLKHPWQTSQGILRERPGRLLRIKTKDGAIGWGDCAPLPEFGISEANATSFAEELAYLDLAAQKAGQTLNSWLSGQAAVQNVAVNANLGSIFTINATSITEALERGFSVLKIKVGIGHWQDEIAHLQHLNDGLTGDAKFRLDTNAAWSEADATSFLRACSTLPIESLEEPLRHPNHANLAKLQQLAAFPIAIDESSHLIDGNFFHHPPVRRLILKPARFGSLLTTIEIALRAQETGVDCIITSSLESNCGLLACAHLAATIAPQAVHGLGTADWFAENMGEAMTLHAGRLELPSAPGLGYLLQTDLP